MATAKPAAKAAPKKKKSGLLFWGIMGILILLLGAGSAYYYVKRDTLKKDARLKVIQDFVDKVDATIGKGADTLKGTLEKGKAAIGKIKDSDGKGGPGASGGSLFGMGGGHVVKPGENLWSIARQGDLVNNPWEWRTILVQNIDKIDYAFISDESPNWQVVLIPGQELSVSNEPPFAPVDSGKRKYTVQMVSLPEGGLDRGVYLTRTLIKDGYYAYLYRTDVGARAVYRLRSGFYDTEEEARAVGQQIREKYQEKQWFIDEPWVSIPEKDELLGSRLDFGAVRVNPWVVEMKPRDTHREALADMKALAKGGEFAYISQGRDQSGRFVYRARVGYFGSEANAKERIGSHKEPLWADARAVKLNNFDEAFPGQLLRLSEK